MDRPEEQEIERAILTALYQAWFEGQILSLFGVQEAGQWDKKIFRRIVDRLNKDEGLIKPYGSSYTYEITTPGILQTENRGLPPIEEIEKHQKARTSILSTLAEAYEKADDDDDLLFAQICESASLDSGECQYNLTPLIDADYVKATSATSFEITSKGLAAVRQWREHTAIADEMEDIATMLPQARGRAFQKLLAKTIEQQGWSQEEGARTSHEEMDIMVYRGSLFYLIECKWEGEPIQAKVIRELFGKLGNRAHVHGIVASMSGFTSGADEQTRDFTGQRTILLFGPEDVRALIEHKQTFDELLGEKQKALLTQRKIVWH